MSSDQSRGGMLKLFCTTAGGTEALLAEELKELGATQVRQDRGGVRCLARLERALRICLHSRIAMRVLYPLGEFEAKGAEGLYEAALSVPWEEHLSARSTFAVEATLKDTEHNHSGFVALKLKDAIADRLREKLGSRPDVDTHAPDVQVVAHLRKTTLSLSLDLCGEPLYQRGYRVLTTPAPMKETLAAALLRRVGYLGEEPFADPLCGSGTLLVEAGLIATHTAPGLLRSFAVEKWPHLGERARTLLHGLREEARAAVRVSPHPLFGRDRDEKALEAVRRNTRAAGLSGCTVIEELDATLALPPLADPGLLLTNPPYGDRLSAGGQKGMKTFYFKLGEALTQWHGWRLGLFVGNEAFESAFHMKPSRRSAYFNGPIACELYEYPPRH